MPVTYELATPDTVALLHKVREEHHEERGLDSVRFGLLMAYGPVDKYGIKSGPAIKGHAGASAAAKVKSVPLKDRVTKEYDVEVLIDGDEWPKLTEQQQTAILDHELTHVCLGDGTDDLGRPKIKMRGEDFIAWGFWEVIQRHGPAAMEHRSLKALADKHGQLLLTLGDTFPPEQPEGTVTISANGTEVGKMTTSEFTALGQEIVATVKSSRRQAAGRSTPKPPPPDFLP